MPLFYRKYIGSSGLLNPYIEAATIDFANSVPNIILTSVSFPSVGSYILMRATSYMNQPLGFPSSLSSGITPPLGRSVNSVVQIGTDIVVTLI